MDPTRVLVVADDPLVRSGVAALLANLPGLVVSGQASPEEIAVAVAGRDHDVVAWAPASKDATGEGLRGAGDGIPVVALVSGSEQAALSLRAHARGVVLRGADGALVGAALVAAAAGLMVLEPSLAHEWLRPPAAAQGGDEPLTPREREVLGLLAEGIGNKAIAARLGISEHTAKFHVNAILAKLGAGSRAEAIVLAARQGLVVL